MLRFLLFCITFSFMTLSNATYKVEISVNGTAIDEYLSLLGDKPCHKVHNFDNASMSFRAVAELVLICKALYVGDPNLSMKLVRAPNYTRAFMMAEEGKVNMPGESIWLHEIDFKNFFSIPIIDSGQMILGLYTSPKNSNLLSIESYEELENYTAVTQGGWIVDLELLNKLNLGSLYTTYSIESMFKMVSVQRVDFLLWTLPNLPNLNQTQHNITLVPVPKLKIPIPYSRHFIISKHSLNAVNIYEALYKGLLIMKEQGVIKKILHQSISTNPIIDDWKEIPIDSEK